MELGNLIFGHSRGEYPVPHEWTDTFVEFLDSVGCDCYGNCTLPEKRNKRGGITTTIFKTSSYKWFTDDNECEHPNFVFFPTGYELRWYKYPLRDSYANQQLTYEQFAAMLVKCRKSLNI